MVEVPAPSIDAPIFVSSAARSTTSGSRAAFSMIGFAAREHCGHQQILGSGDADAVESELAPFEPVRRFGFDVAVLLMDFRAQPFQRRDVQIDGPRADGAAAGKRNPRASVASQQRAQHQARSPHGFDQIVGRFGMIDLRRLRW